MKGIAKNSFVVLLLCASVAWISCSDDNGNSSIDPNDPSTFVGTYDFVTIQTSTFGQITAGEPFDIGGGIMVTIEGTLVLTSSQYTFTFEQTTTIPGAGSSTDTDVDMGTYAISGSGNNLQITIDPDDDDPFTLDVEIDGNRVTINDIPDEDLGTITIVLEKR